MMRSRCMSAALALALAATLSACQTRKPADDAGPPQETVLFQPAAVLSNLHFQGGPYPSLFAPSSHAVWVDEGVTALRRQAAAETGDVIAPEAEAEAAAIAENFVIIECHLDSVFEDMSIAYDVVGMRERDISLYLSTPDRRRIAPIQTLIGSRAREEQRQALKLFGRTNLVIFPKRDLWLNRPVLGPNMASVRLVIEGYDSTFYFEWPGERDPARASWAPSPAEAAAILKTGFREFHDRVSRLAHIFD